MDRSEVRRVVHEVVERLLPPSPPDAAGGSNAASSAAAPPPAPPVAEGAALARWFDWRGTGDSAKHRERSFEAPAPAPAGDVSRVVAIGADHGAVALKRQLVRFLRDDLARAVIDCGTHSEEAVDYPDVARAVAQTVASGRAARGIVLDAMGIGSAMAANRVPGVLCAVCHDVDTVRNAREHNDANVLSLGSRVVHPGMARQLVRLFLTTPHAGGRHARRVSKIRALDDTRASLPRGA